MDDHQALVHAARRTADRLADRFDPTLPHLVEAALAERESGTTGAGYDTAPGGGPGVALANFAAAGWQALLDEAPSEPLTRERLRRQILADVPPPTGVDPARIEAMLSVLTEELLAAYQVRRGGAGGGAGEPS